MVDLDTSFLIEALREGTDQAALLGSWRSLGETMEISAIAWGEFLSGPLTAGTEEMARVLFPRPRALEQDDAERAALLFNQTGRRSKSYVDCCIAASAIRAGSRLATSNEDDFKRMLPHGLRLA